LDTGLKLCPEAGSVDETSRRSIGAPPRWPDRACEHRRLSTLICGLVLLLMPVPAAAYGGPLVLGFGFYFTTAVAWELLVIVAVLLPSALYRGSARWRAMSTGVRAAMVLAVAAAFVGLLHFGVPDRIATTFPGSDREQYSSECESLGQQAADLGLDASDMLLDLRMPGQHGIYHVKGSCNVDPARLLTDPDFRERLERNARRVFIVCEWAQTVYELYNGLLDAGSSPERWQMLESGLFYFRLAPDASPRARVIDVRLTHEQAHASREDNVPKAAILDDSILGMKSLQQAGVVTTLGQQILFRFGPHYSRAWEFTILGNHPSWRQRPSTFLLDPTNAQVTRIVIEENSFEPRVERDFLGSVALLTGRVRTTLADLDAAGGQVIQNAVFLCDNVLTCPAAESLARDLLDRGGEVAGYVIHNGSYDTIRSRPVLDGPFGSPWLWLALFCVVAILVRGRLVGYLHRSRFAVPRGLLDDMRVTLAGLLAATTPMVLGSLMGILAEHLVPAGRVLDGLFLVDAFRAGNWMVGLIAPVLLVLIIDSLFRFRPLRGNVVFAVAYWAAALSIVVFLFTETYANNHLEERRLSGFDGLVLLVLFGAPPLAAWARLGLAWIRSRLSGRPVVLLPLELADSVCCAGQKAQWLAQAMRCGMTVPGGFIVVTSIDDFRRLAGAADTNRRALGQVLAPVRGFLREGPAVVRSSAPDEDLAGGGTAGRFTSVQGVGEAGLIEAILRVLDSYERGGVDPGRRVAVIVQHQASARHAGVAVREARDRGAGILIEAAADDTGLVTSGRGVHLWGRIGACSNEYVSGGIHAAGIPSRCFSDAFRVLEDRFGCDLAVEWCWTGGAFVLLQARPSTVALTPSPGTGAGEVLERLAPALRRYPYESTITVLDSAELPDMQYGALPATAELVNDINQVGSMGSRLKAASSWPSRFGPRPVVLAMAGGLYLNRVPDRPVLLRLVQSLVRLADLELRLLPGGYLSRMQKRLETSHGLLLDVPLPGTGGQVAELARMILALRGSVLEHPAADFFDVAYMMNALRIRGKDGLGRFDPFLMALGRNEASGELAMRFPYRATREYALELPRAGEAGGYDAGAMRQAYADRMRWIPQAGGGRNDMLLRLQALARDSLSYGVALMRLGYLELGAALGTTREATFSLRQRDLEMLAAGGALPRTLATETPVTAASGLPPTRMSLGDLEARAAGDTGLAQPEGRGFWVSGHGPKQGVVVGGSNDVVPVEDGCPIRVAQHPTVEDAMRAAPGTVVVALGGNRLCHAAVVLQERGIDALFGAEPYRDLLREGTRVRLAADGTVARLEHGQGDDAGSRAVSQ
jgi:hypothetical protein